MTKVMHMSVHKRYLIQLIHEEGVKAVLPDAPDAWTVADGVKYLQEQPWVYHCNCDCPKDDEGACMGTTD